MASRIERGVAATRRFARETALNRRRRVALLAATGVLATLVGVFSTWASGDGFSLNGTQGPQNGWIAVFYVVIGVAVLAPLTRRSWPGILTTLLVAAAVLTTVIDNQAAPDLSSGWGFWLTLAGGVLLACAGLLAAATRLGEEREARRHRPVGADETG